MKLTRTTDPPVDQRASATLAKREDEHGQIEYVIVLFLVALTCFGAWKRFGSSVSSTVDEGGTMA